MHLRRLVVADFRSWEKAELDLEPGVTVLVGPNGVGKTNLVEAAGYLATLGSHRVASDAPLIRRGADRAVVRGLIVHHGRELGVELEITAGKANRARVNRAPVAKPRDVLGILRTVLFAPEDLALVRGDPGERRRFLDDLLVSRYPRYAAVRSDYDRVLRQRSALLKTARASRADLSTLDVWDGHLARHGAVLLAGRLELLAAIAPLAVEAFAEVAPTSDPIALVYRSTLDGDLPATAAELEVLLLDALARVRRQEVERGVCLVGPHRDDLELRLGVGPAKGYASHGESWALALALRLASYRLLRDDDVEPVLVLDDVFAELDSHRRSALAAVARRAEQVLITAAVPEDVPDALAGVRFAVGGGTVDRLPQDATSTQSVLYRQPVDKVVYTVYNVGSLGDDEQKRPPAVRREPPVAGPSRPVVPRPGDGTSGTAGRSAEGGRGADIARDALRAAREASAERASQRAAERQGRKPAAGRSRRRRWSGPGPDDRDPQPFGRLVSRVSLDRGWSPRLTDATVLGRWPQLVGSEIADHCTPLSLRDGELVLQAESTAWATQLRTMQRQLLVRLAGAVGKDVVRRIRVVAPSGPSWRHGPRSVRGRGPRDTYG